MNTKLVREIMEKTGAERQLIHYYMKLDENGLERVEKNTKRAIKIINLIKNEKQSNR